MPTLREQIEAALILRKGTAELDAFISGTVEGMFGGATGKYWRGPRLEPTASQYGPALKRIQDNFLVQNLVASVIENHVDAFLGKEPEFQMMRGEAKADPETVALADWYALQNVQATLYDAASTLLYATAGQQTSSLMRFYVSPRASRDGTIARAPLETQLARAVRLEHIPTSRGGVLREGSDIIAGFYTYTSEQYGVKQELLEFVALDSEFEYQKWDRLITAPVRGDTVIQIRSGYDYSTVLAEAVYPLGGNLTITEVQRKPFVTEDVISQNAGLNTSWTYVNKGGGAAAFMERVFLNGLPPGKWVNEKGEPDENGRQYKPDVYEVGPGTTNFIGGTQDKDGKYTTASVAWHDPPSMVPLLEVIEAHKRAIYSLCNQEHLLIAGDATASGVARQQAAQSFINSLRPSTRAMKTGVTWALETALRLGGYLETGGEAYTDVSADVTLNVEAVQPTPDELRLYLEQRSAGVFDTLELMRRSGIANTDDMLARVAAEQTKTRQTQPMGVQNGSES